MVWVWDVVRWVQDVLLIICLGIELFALVNCLFQRAEAFPVVGRIPKGGWIAILVLSVMVTLLANLTGGGIGILAFIAITAALFYLLDVRRGLRDAVEGGPGSW
jgi:Protein of unknown function (DUF2516)